MMKQLDLDWDEPTPGISPKEAAEQEIAADIDALVAGNEAKRLDAAFYAPFSPEAQTELQSDNLGRCYDCAELLATELNRTQGRAFTVCRGVLHRLNAAFKREFGHGWVEDYTSVYDTTWQVKMDKSTYYNLFNAEIRSEKVIAKNDANRHIDIDSGYEL